MRSHLCRNQSLFRDEGVLQYRSFGYGHSFGILSHYYGREAGLELREDIETVLEPGMVVSMEPMLWVPDGQPGAGGYREHDILVVGEPAPTTSPASRTAPRQHHRGVNSRLSARAGPAPHPAGRHSLPDPPVFTKWGGSGRSPPGRGVGRQPHTRSAWGGPASVIQPSIEFVERQHDVITIGRPLLQRGEPAFDIRHRRPRDIDIESSDRN